MATGLHREEIILIREHTIALRERLIIGGRGTRERDVIGIVGDCREEAGRVYSYS